MKNKTVVITGAAGGIGRALAHSFARRGARVALLDRDAAGAQAVAAALADARGKTGGNSLALGCDVTAPAECQSAIDAVSDRWGGVDVLVNNAGITQLGLFRDTRIEVIRSVMEVNFFGAVNCTKAALPSLLERKGQIVVISSVAGFAPLASRSGYAASKHALHGFFDSLRAEHTRDGLRILLVCPSFVDTAIGEHALGGDGRRAPQGARTGVGAAADPKDVAEAVVRAAQADRRLLLVPRQARLSFLVSRLAPRLYQRLMIRRTLGTSG